MMKHLDPAALMRNLRFADRNTTDAELEEIKAHNAKAEREHGAAAMGKNNPVEAVNEARREAKKRGL